MAFNIFVMIEEPAAIFAVESWFVVPAEHTRSRT
jgi:hypothetical protein